MIGYGNESEDIGEAGVWVVDHRDSVWWYNDAGNGQDGLVVSIVCGWSVDCGAWDHVICGMVADK